MSNQNTFTVSELTKRIKGVLETSFGNVSVEGEISNFKRHSSGHLYFTLKDEGAQISAVMWRGRAGNLFFTPQDGMKVIANGKITLYEPQGKYQIDVFQLQPRGIGELQIAFEKLKQKLAGEGLFDSEHKKPLPEYPERIGIITSPTGAALQDMLNILNRRFPSLEVILNPVKVQGEGASHEIASAIKDFNKFGEIDVLIIGRGGGSLEDLWAFNEEIVARAIYNSKVPIVSAVGHEIDFTIADFVADLRAPTPSAAAELVVKDKLDIFENIRNFCYTMEQDLENTIKSRKEKIVSLIASYSFNRPKDLIKQNAQRIDELDRQLDQTINYKINILHEQTRSLDKRLKSLNPDSVLERGYSIIYRSNDIISRAKKLKSGDDIRVKFHDGEKSAAVS
ncbi:MAG: exodeoxyribonuclease VII large subunit [Ignavibacteriales bacterium]|nr:exodeoxyribonuclease VII large subunit [Ignavibacteriales bacterium]